MIERGMYFDHDVAKLLLLPLVLLALAIWTLLALRGRRKLIHILAGVGTASLALALFLWLVVAVWAMLTTSTETSPRIDSPDRKHALVVRVWQGGGRAGTRVYLYSHWGLHEDEIASGKWRGIQAKNVRWTSNSEVVIVYTDAQLDKPLCDSTESVHVLCTPAP